jgi:hypothetical protein
MLGQPILSARCCASVMLLPAIALAAGCRSATGGNPAGGPQTARLVTEDIPRFWAAFDSIRSSTDTVPLRRDYLDRGSVGLKDFTSLRWKDSKTLTAMVWPRRDYYRSIRANTLAVASLEVEIRRTYHMLDTMYADAVFPDVYFAIGGMSTGGTTSDHGLLIGTELYSRASDSPVNVLTAWQQTVVRSVEVLPAIVAHELVHYQQKYRGTNLLGESLREGGADFVSQLLTGRTINEHMYQYATTHEREIWLDFSDEMNGTDHSRWLYNGGTVTATTERPADLGYFVGYRITQAYYERQPDKRQALRDIFNIKNFTQFLAASGYAARFAP